MTVPYILQYHVLYVLYVHAHKSAHSHSNHQSFSDSWRLSLETMRILSFLLATSVCFADIASHRYKQGEHVELWVNKVKHVDIVVFSSVTPVSCSDAV